MGGKGSKPKTKSSNNLGSTKSSKTSAKKGCLPGKKPKPIALPPSRPVADLPAPSLELGGRRFTHGVSGWIEESLEPNWEALVLQRDVLQLQEKLNQLKFKNALLMDMLVLTNLDGDELQEDLRQCERDLAEPPAEPPTDSQSSKQLDETAFSETLEIDTLGSEPPSEAHQHADLNSTMPSEPRHAHDLGSTSASVPNLGSTTASDLPNVGGFLIAGEA